MKFCRNSGNTFADTMQNTKIQLYGPSLTLRGARGEKHFLNPMSWFLLP